ncbi:MAG: hypothetical protein H5T99_13065, partial [Moorella sp. (in: Bacteria)]|nr:hypothetical protein [Moorella sp. (in: firmicutes)]
MTGDGLKNSLKLIGGTALTLLAESLWLKALGVGLVIAGLGRVKLFGA